MEKIASFRADHRKIVPGIYLSRTDGDVATYDLRVKKPNAGDYMSHIEMHTTEHLFATFIRNSEIGQHVVYFGPMGCRTRFLSAYARRCGRDGAPPCEGHASENLLLRGARIRRVRRGMRQLQRARSGSSKKNLRRISENPGDAARIGMELLLSQLKKGL